LYDEENLSRIFISFDREISYLKEYTEHAFGENFLHLFDNLLQYITSLINILDIVEIEYKENGRITYITIDTLLIECLEE
jgi:hypothetical protein